MSSPKIGIFWPGDYRSKPNELARANAEEATVQLERAFGILNSVKSGDTTHNLKSGATRLNPSTEAQISYDVPKMSVVPRH